jgi:hypothetical protein
MKDKTNEKGKGFTTEVVGVGKFAYFALITRD